MNISDTIQIIIGTITGIGVLSSIIISTKTLKQNSKMIEESTRPNVIMYKDTLNVNSPIEYIVIKNIGGSLAHIVSITFNDVELKQIKWEKQDIGKALCNLNNSYLAPQQFYRIPILTRNTDLKNTIFQITYKSNVKTYSETYILSLKQDSAIVRIQQHHPNNELQVISNAIQELIKRIS